jgi:hypothetical protein
LEEELQHWTRYSVNFVWKSMCRFFLSLYLSIISTYCSELPLFLKVSSSEQGISQ